MYNNKLICFRCEKLVDVSDTKFLQALNEGETVYCPECKKKIEKMFHEEYALQLGKTADELQDVE